jgi:YVTN family beta-propeller protein
MNRIAGWLAVALLVPATGVAQEPGYRVGVTSESGDIVTWLRPLADGTLATERVVAVNPRPPEIDGPHNITVAPDQGSYYVSIAHGTPWGSLWRLDARTHRVLGTAQAEGYPTTIALTPDGEFAFVANSDFFGDRPRVNPVTIVHTPTMTTITQLATCDMPHGVRSNRAGTTVWVSCMHSDELVAIDVASLAITHRIRLGAGHAEASGHGAHAGHAMASTPTAPPATGPDLTRPCAATYVALSPDDARLYVACNAAGTMQVWNAATRAFLGQVTTGAGAYNVEPSPDGRLVIVTNKKDRSVSVIDAASLTELRRVPVSKPVVHGVAFAPDGRHAYVSQESIGADPGAVDTIDLATLTVIGTIPIPAQPTGLTILRTR